MCQPAKVVPLSTGKAGGPGFPDISVTSHGLNTALQSHSLGILQGNLKDPVDVELGPPIGGLAAGSCGPRGAVQDGIGGEALCPGFGQGPAPSFPGSECS